MTELRALVVEDDSSWQRLLSEILADAGLEVDVAANRDQAEEMLRAVPHRLAVVDLSLRRDRPETSGLDVLDAIRRHDPGCVPLLLTGFATVELAVSALSEHGAFTCLRKEAFRRSEFREWIRRALNQPPLGRAGAEDQPAVPVGQAAAAAGCALLAEDDAGWRSILQELLGQAGYRVCPCASYGEARGCLRRGRYDLAVVDLALASSLAPTSNRDGYRLLQAVRAAGIPTLVVSGTGSPADLERAYAEYGVFACIEKHAFDRLAFLRTVAEAQEGGPSPASELQRLTEREREVLELLARGMGNHAIAVELCITPNTVKRHLKAIFAKLNVHTRAAAAARAVAAGLPPEPGGDSGRL